MSVGFAATTQTSDHIISNFFKQNHSYCDDINEARVYWYNEYRERFHNPSVESLLDPEYLDFEITKNPKFDNVRSSHAHQIPHFIGQNGLWGISLVDDNGHLDFTIKCWAGDCMRFQPDVIQESITGLYGSTVYNSWKSIVMDDIDSLQVLVDEIRKKINKMYYSITCCDRSSRLCERVGIPVRNGHAFLFPSKVKV